MIDFFEISNEMLCLANAQGIFTKVNAAWTKTLGWSADELTSRPYLDFVHPDDLAATTREANLLAAGEYETLQFENRYCCKDGSYRWLAWRVVPDLETGVWICAAHDVTNQKQQTEDLRAAKERFSTLVSHAPIGIAQADAAGDVFFVNQKWCELADVNPDETLGARWQEHVHPDDLPGLLSTWQAHVVEGRDMPAYEFRFRHRSGEIRWGSVMVALLKDADRRVVGQIATVADVTDRKNAELHLREAEERFRAFMSHTPTVSWAKDDQGEIVFLNRAAEEMFGLASGQWRGKTDYDFWPKETADRLRANDRRVLESNQPMQIFEETESPELALQYWMTFLFPYEAGGGRRFVGGVGIDITEIKRSEAALKAKQDLLRNLIDAQENERQRLCHEFHDGLIQYAVGAKMLLEGYRSSRLQNADLAAINDAIESLERGIIDGRRTIHGIRPAVLDDFDLAAACHDLAEQFSTSDFRVTCNCNPRIGRLPEALQTAAYRLIQESLNNARKHSGADHVEIDVERVGDELQIEVRDRGRGFDAAAVRGRGFGLQGMHERVRLKGGELKVSSEPGAGTHVQIRLPIRADETE
jgi:PAS domain S-box-containing protein